MVSHQECLTLDSILSTVEPAHQTQRIGRANLRQLSSYVQTRLLQIGWMGGLRPLHEIITRWHINMEANETPQTLKPLTALSSPDALYKYLILGTTRGSAIYTHELNSMK